ncbi:MAG: SDR family NAD(P)-dependent oxidoreductase [Verrucomicrobiota bacterium]|nr:SDR family NAD(P)-dependent oxidoreductase [Verrucomicrobiota bacterium]
MKTFKEKYGPWALITGASSGIGEEFARQLAKEGIHLALHGRDMAKLDTLSNHLREQYNIYTRIILADLDIADAWRRILIETEDLEIRLLVNNAGYIIHGGVLKSTPEKEIGLLNTNCLTPLALSQHFAVEFAQAKRGGIIFTSSVASYVAAPFWTQYSATKSYDLLLAEALWAELRPHGVDVQALCPGPTKTHIFRRSGAKVRATFFHMTTTAVVGESLLNLGRKPVVIAGLRNKLLVSFLSLLPRRWRTLINYRIMKTMIEG